MEFNLKDIMRFGLVKNKQNRESFQFICVKVIFCLNLVEVERGVESLIF